MYHPWRRACLALALTVGLALSTRASAIEPQYRRVTLVDGRVISAEILATEAKGLRMRIPAGETLISFELLLDMVPISQAEYDAQPPWIVYFSVPPEKEREIVELLQAVDGVTPQPVSVAANGITTTMAVNAGKCNDIGCMVEAVDEAPWMWVLMGSTSAPNELRIQAKLNTSPDAPYEATVPFKERDELWRVLHEAMGLTAPATPKLTDGSRPTTDRTFDERKVVTLSFVPVPGLPSLAQKDMGGFGLAMGMFVPSTALCVGAFGVLGTSDPELIALTSAGLYTMIVFTNQVAGMRSLEKQRIGVTALPTRGGATVVLGRSF